MNDPAAATDALNTIMGLGGGAGGGILGTLVFQKMFNRNEESVIKIEGADLLLSKVDDILVAQRDMTSAVARMEGALSRINGG